MVLGDNMKKMSVAPTALAHYNKYLVFNPQSDSVTLEERFLALKFSQRTIDEMVLKVREYLQDRDVQSWDELLQELPMGRTDAGALHLDEAIIKKSLQRTVVEKHVKNILTDYQLNRVVSVCWFHDENDNKVIWDGQHTALALYFIARYVFQLKDMHVLIPNTSFNFTTPEARDAYMSNGSGEGKEWISNFEIIRQIFMATEYAIQNDVPSVSSEHERLHRRLWMMLENGLYLTPLQGENRFKYQADGMFGRIPEFKDMGHDDILQNYISWYKLGPQRPVIHWNAIIPYEYFRDMYNKNKRPLTSQELQELADITSRWQHDFDNDKTGWWMIAKKVYENFHRRVIYPQTKKSPLMKSSGELFSAIFHGYLQHKGASSSLYIQHYSDTFMFVAGDFKNV